MTMPSLDSIFLILINTSSILSICVIVLAENTISNLLYLIINFLVNFLSKYSVKTWKFFFIKTLATSKQGSMQIIFFY